MLQSIVNKIKSLNFDIEYQSETTLKVRGEFQNHDVIIYADHCQQVVTIVSHSFRDEKRFSYQQFFSTFCQ